jgi:hypothetical protein
MAGTGNTAACLHPRRAPEFGKLSGVSPTTFTTTTSSSIRASSQAQRRRRQNTIYLNYVLQGDYDTIDHDNNGFIDIDIKGYTTSSASSPVRCVTIDLTARGVRLLYRGKLYFIV